MCARVAQPLLDLHNELLLEVLQVDDVGVASHRLDGKRIVIVRNLELTLSGLFGRGGRLSTPLVRILVLRRLHATGCAATHRRGGTEQNAAAFDLSAKCGPKRPVELIRSAGDQHEFPVRRNLTIHQVCAGADNERFMDAHVRPGAVVANS